MAVELQTIPYGKEDLILETGRLAKQANASILATVGGTVVLVSVVAADKAVEGMDFFPLMVDYREKFYSAGKFPGGYFKREGRPGDLETLRARLIDRAVRPLFPNGYKNEVQIYCVVLSFDLENAAETAALTAASAALNISNIPFSTPVAAVRVAEVDGQLVLNPTYDQMVNATLDLVVAGTKSDINMVEAGANELPEDRMIEALQFAHDAIRKAIEAQEQFISRCAVPKTQFVEPQDNPELAEEVRRMAEPLLPEMMEIPSKLKREERVSEIRASIWEQLKDRFPDEAKRYGDVFYHVHKKFLRKRYLETGKRADGRGLTDIRPITGEVGVLPKTHGSAIFTRGETQALAAVTLGTVGDQQKLDNILGVSLKRFMLHYNFPNFSVGETGRISGPGRREIGHGALAERAITPVIPDAEHFPYTVRVVSEILESNGSSSMATVCGATLALMDAGVPIKKPVAGIAMGLIKEGEDVLVLSDILGLEDHLGDMDFKVTGTEQGVTALQMDIKINGVSQQLLEKALGQAREGRMHILGKMAETLQTPRSDIAPHAPRIEVIRLPVEKIKDVIGSGGKIIRSIIEEFNVKIDIEDDGTCYVAASEGASMKGALEKIRSLITDAELDQVYTGKVVRIADFGAFVEILPNRDGLVHISELEVGRVAKVEDVCREGDMLTVKVIGIDESGKIRLSRKQILLDAMTPEQREEAMAAARARQAERAERGEGGSSGGSRGGERRGGGGGGRDRDRGGRGGGGRRDH